jgi:aminoglycoside phosphotransferase (APT) family kinase protein
MTTRSCILQSADSLTNGDRQAEYGPPAENFGRIADYWNAYLAHHGWSGPQLHGADVAAMMALLKIARMVESPRKADTYIDASGYIALAGELAGVQP